MGTEQTAARSTVREWINALRSADGNALQRLLAADPEFVSPFNHFATHRHVASACAARCRAFLDWRETEVLDGPPGRVGIVWQAELDGGREPVNGVELVEVRAGRVARVDVFLRPAEVLPLVHDAMQRHWR